MFIYYKYIKFSIFYITFKNNTTSNEEKIANNKEKNLVSVAQLIMLGVSKNIEKPIKPRKLEKKITEKLNREKN
jgi:hypothetical protein